MLKSLGYDIDNKNGYFDESTENVTKEFQKKEKLKEDGVITGETTTELMNKLREKIQKSDTQMKKAVEVLKDWGYTKMINGCFEGNPSNEFYKRMGGKFVGTTMLTLQNGQELVENLYCYDEI